MGLLLRLRDRINLFWLGAGGFLALFCANEIVANHVSQAPVWLGGRLVYVASYVGLAMGLLVAAFLGVEEPPEADAEDPADAPGSASPVDADADHAASAGEAKETAGGGQGEPTAHDEDRGSGADRTGAPALAGS